MSRLEEVKTFCARCGKTDAIEEVDKQENIILHFCDKCRAELHGNNEKLRMFAEDLKIDIAMIERR